MDLVKLIGAVIAIAFFLAYINNNWRSGKYKRP